MEFGDNTLYKTLAENISNLKEFEDLLLQNVSSYSQAQELFTKKEVDDYKKLISTGLHDLTLYVLKKEFNNPTDELCVLPSYSSLIVDWHHYHNNPRIYPLKSTSLESEHNLFNCISLKQIGNNVQLTKYIESTLNKIWNKVPLSFQEKQKEFTIHEFAQLKIGTDEYSSIKRVPILISNRKIEDSKFQIYSKYSIDGNCSFNEIVESFSKYLNNALRNNVNNKRVTDPAKLDLYVAYMLTYTGLNINKLKSQVKQVLLKHGISQHDYDRIEKHNNNYPFLKDIYFTAIGISDEISDEPLGTIMMWSLNSPIRFSKLRKVHDDVFMYFDALRKIEYRIKTIIQERRRGQHWLELMSQWAVHEIKSLTSVSRRIKNKAVSINDFTAETNIIQSIADNILKIDSKSRSTSFTELIELIEKNCTWDDTELLFRFNKDNNIVLPKDLEYIVLELLRNAHKYSCSDKNRIIRVETETIDSFFKIIISNRIDPSLDKHEIEDIIHFLNSKIEFDNLPKHVSGNWLIKWVMLTKEIGSVKWCQVGDNLVCSLKSKYYE